MSNMSLSETVGSAMTTWDNVSGTLTCYLDNYMYLREIDRVDEPFS